jgi:hypothetical protein
MWRDRASAWRRIYRRHFRSTAIHLSYGHPAVEQKKWFLYALGHLSELLPSDLDFLTKTFNKQLLLYCKNE